MKPQSSKFYSYSKRFSSVIKESILGRLRILSSTQEQIKGTKLLSGIFQSTILTIVGDRPPVGNLLEHISCNKTPKL